MIDFVTLVETFGPIMGLTLFMVWKQLQIGATKPRLEAIEKKLDTIIRKLEDDEQPSEPDDQGRDLPAEEAVR